MSLRPAIFLDRDGVIIEDTHYLSSIDQVQLIPGSAEAIAALNRAGWVVVVITNQAGVARGFFRTRDVEAVHSHLSALLAGYGATIEAYYYCPHHPSGDVAEYREDCSCRKPKPGMIQRAADELKIDLKRSWMVGDRESDLQAGASAGARTILVRTGYGATADVEALDRTRLNLEHVAANLAEAVESCRLAIRSLE